MELDRFDRCWFAVQVRPRYEFLAANTLRGKGFEEFLPTYKTKRKWSDRTKQVELPLFPGYVFCKFNSGIRAPIVTTSGVIRILGGNSSIPDSEIEAIQAVVASRLPASPCTYLKIGTKVEVTAGPLMGIQGILTSYAGYYRLVLSVDLVRNSISVEVEYKDVVPVQECAQLTQERHSIAAIPAVNPRTATATHQYRQ